MINPHEQLQPKTRWASIGLLYNPNQESSWEISDLNQHPETGEPMITAIVFGSKTPTAGEYKRLAMWARDFVINHGNPPSE